METLRLSLLGGFAAERAGLPVAVLNSDKPRLLLAYLAVEHDRPHRRDSLAGLFWPDSPESLARHSLSHALYSLNKIFQDDSVDSPLIITAQEVRLRPEHIWLDVQEFESLIEACQEHGHGTLWTCRPCLQRLEQAQALYRGEFLVGYALDGDSAFEEWMLLQQEIYRRKMLQALGWLSCGFELLGEYEQALQYATQQALLNPLDEAAHRQVMQLLARQGRHAEALAQFEVCRKTLDEELGTEPEESTTALCQLIRSTPGSGVSFPLTPNNLPATLEPLIGREKELDQIIRLLSGPACRLLTILGGGGAGKSRLALEAGHLLLPSFPDGVFLVMLDTQQTGQALLPLIAQTVGLDLRTDKPIFGQPGNPVKEEIQAQLSGFLKSKKMLLILDGFEGALHETTLISALLRSSPALRILVTSRARLNMEIEQILSLEGLPYPQEGQKSDPALYSAVELFVSAARRLQPEFLLTEANAPAVAEICRITRGFPLGILLAASWIGTLEPIEIFQEIQHSLDFLHSDWQDLPDRQRSLRATFDHSWRLLPAPERETFLGLAVFHGSFTAERARQAAGASLDQLRILHDHSMLICDSTPYPHPTMRYRLHDLLRQYAQEKLAASPTNNLAAHERHAQVYLSALEAWGPRLKSNQQAVVLAEMDQEYADILAAWDWAAAHRQVEAIQRGFDAFSYYHNLRRLFMEDSQLCQRVMQGLEDEPVTTENLSLWLLMGAWRLHDIVFLGDYALAWQLLGNIEGRLQQWDGLAGEMNRGRGLLNLAKGDLILFNEGNRLQALGSYQQGLALMLADEDPWDISYAMMKVATGHDQLGNIHEYGRIATRALGILQSVGDPNILAALYRERGYAFMLSGDYQAGLQAVQEQNVYLLHNETPLNQAVANEEMGLAAYYSGQYEQARSYFEEAISLLLRTFDPPGWQYFARYMLACTDVQTGHYAEVLNDAAYAGVKIPAFYQNGLDLPKALVHLVEAPANVSPDAAALFDMDKAEQELHSYLTQTRSLPRLDMLGEPLALSGYIAYRRGRMEEAVQYLQEAITNALEQGFILAFLTSLSVLAVMLAETGEFEQAVETYATVTAHPMAGYSRWYDDMFGSRLRALSASLPAEILEAARARGRKCDLTTAARYWLDRLGSSKVVNGRLVL